jgi:predicted nucleic acid-binding protein
MTVDAYQTYAWPYAGIGRRLRRHPHEVQQLHRYHEALSDIVGCGVIVLPVSTQHILLAADLSRANGMLSGDALVLAVMQSYGLANLASTDADFDRITGINRFAPV